MRLLSLKIWGYKNFEEVKIDFSKSQGKTLVVGTNGSGKSNLLEILSAIFSAYYNKDDNVNPNFKFELEYVIEQLKMENYGGSLPYKFPISVRLKNPTGVILMEAHDDESNWKSVNNTDFDALLPEHVVAIYSGEEKRLWDKYYYPSYNEYNKQYRSGGSAYHTQRMIYLNKYYWNIIASVLAIHEIEDFKRFLHQSIGLKDITSIHCTFDVKAMKSNKNTMASELLSILNPEMSSELDITLEKYCQAKEICGYEHEFFYNMIVLALYKDFKIITDLTIKCANGVEIKDLSEGEKKLLLIFGALNIVSGENLYLFDEPDAHLHEGRKREIFELIQTDYISHFVITSHSPSLTYMFPIECIQVLTNNENGVKVLEEDKKHAIHRLTDGIWCAETQCILLEGDQDLLLVEGKGDTRYIKNAINYWKEKEDKYRKLNLFILPFGGTGNCEEFIQNIIEAGVVNRKIIALFDADGSGRGKFSELIGISGTNYSDKVYDVNDKTKALLLPKPLSNTNSEFMIEDYFDLSGYEEERERRYSLCNGAKAKSEFKFSTKKYISEHCDEIGYDGFQILCDKLLYVLDSFSEGEENMKKKELIAI